MAASIYPIICVIGAIAFVTQSAVLALSPQQIGEIARNTTIQIRGEDGSWGSGVIVKQEGKNYYAISSFHVIDKPTHYQIITPDRQIYELNVNRIKGRKDRDSAVVKFTSDKIYKIPKIGNSNLLKTNTPIYIAGFSRSSFGFDLLFHSGRVIANSKLYQDYGLIYTNNSRPGMSGGGVFNQNGELVAIQGRGEVSKFYDGVDRIITGNARGIAINTFLNLKLLDLSILPARKEANFPDAEDFYVLGLSRQKSKNYSGAIAAYTKAIKLNPKYAYAYYKRGDSYYQQQKYRNSIRDFTQAIQFGLRDADVYNYRGLSHYSLGNYRAANSDYTMAIALDPNYYYAYSNRADIRYGLKQYKIAIQDYSKAISLNPEPKYLYLYRAHALYELGKIDMAIQDWRRARKYVSKDRIGSLDLAIAVALYRRGETAQALELAEISLQTKPDLANRGAIKTLGWGNRLRFDAQKLFQDSRIRAIAKRKLRSSLLPSKLLS